MQHFFILLKRCTLVALAFLHLERAMGGDSPNSVLVDIPPLRESQVIRVRKELLEYEKGTLSYEALTKENESGARILGFYIAHTNEITAKMKLPIARSYAVHGNYLMAAKLATDYVGVYSNDWRGWSILFGAYAVMKMPQEAFAAGTNVIRLGSDSNIAAIGIATIQTEHFDVFSRMIYPRLLVLRDAANTSIAEKLDILKALVVYSLKTKREEAFVSALKGIKFSEIAANDELCGLVRSGCELFHPGETAELCRDLSETRAKPQ